MSWPSRSDEIEPIDFEPWAAPFAAHMVKESNPMDFNSSPSPFGAPQSFANVALSIKTKETAIEEIETVETEKEKEQTAKEETEKETEET